MKAFFPKTSTASLWVLWLAGSAFGCGGGGGGGGDGGGPIGPSTLVIAAGGDVLNAAFESTILRCDLLLDGKVIATTQYAQASADCGQLVGSATTTKGNHTVAFRITSQVSSPTTYETVGASVVTETSTIMLGDRTQSLATGESISYSVLLP